MANRKIILSVLTISLSIMFCSCKKNEGQQDQGQSYIPEPTTSTSTVVASTETATGADTQTQTADEQNATASDEASGQDTKTEEKTAENSTESSTAEGEKKEETAVAEESKPEETQQSQTTTENTENISQDTQEKKESEQEAKDEQPASSETNSEAKTEESEENKNNEEEEYALDAKPQDVMAEPEPIFGSCENMHKYMAACAPFKCSRATTFLGQPLDDTFEIKGKRNGKCRYVTGVHMQAKGKAIDSVNLICNLGDGDRLMASEYLKDPENIKYTTLDGIRQNSENTVKPFTKFFMDNVCVQACRKSQTEIEQTIFENGHFVTKKVRCPSDD